MKRVILYKTRSQYPCQLSSKTSTLVQSSIFHMIIKRKEIHHVETVRKSNVKIVVTRTIDTHNTDLQERSRLKLVTDTAITNGELKVSLPS